MTQTELAAADDIVLAIDLASVDRRELRQALASPDLDACRAGGNTLHLFLDSLDEAKIHITHRVFHLAELGASHVQTAAKERGLDPDRVLREILDRDAGGFASKPLTLFMLLDITAEQGELPRSLRELYRRGLRLLCREPDTDRAGPALNEDERYAVVRRLAAASVLSGIERFALEPADAASGTIDPGELIGGVERLPRAPLAASVAVGTAAVRETLLSGLFKGAGSGVVTWSHRSFAEFLASEWLAREEVRLETARDILCERDGERARIIPQLRATAGWLITARPELADAIHHADAVYLLHGDTDTIPRQLKGKLFSQIVLAIDESEVDRWDVHRSWRKLAYDGMAADIVAAARDSALSVRARQATVDAGREAGLDEVAEAFAGLALDREEDLQLRIAAAEACGSLGGPEIRSLLKPLARSQDPADTDDALKAAALEACWPGLLSADEVFDAIAPPRNPDLIGAYHTFLTRKVLPELRSPTDLEVALRWALEVPRGWHLLSPLASLVDEILAAAWPLAATSEGVAAAVAKRSRRPSTSGSRWRWKRRAARPSS